jgi:hypothetical protein
MRHLKTMGILVILSLSQNVKSQTTYDYYVALNNYTVVPNNYSKSDLLNYVNTIYGASNLYNNLNSNATTVRRAFKGAKTPLLKRAIFISSNSPNLASQLNSYSTYFEKAILFPKKVNCSTPNDFYYCTSRTDSAGTTVNGIQNTQTSTFCVNTQLDLIRAREAWEIEKGDPRIKIAVADDYLDTGHEDIRSRIDTIYSLTSYANHGTEVSGSAIAHSDNGKGISSIAGYKCKLVFADGGLEDLVTISARKGVRVVNASWGWRGEWFNSIDTIVPDFIREAADEIIDSNHCVFVSAAANGKCWACNGCSCSDTSWVYPAAYEKVFSVTSVGHKDEAGSSNRYVGVRQELNWRDVHIAGFNTGQNAHHNSRVDVCAPGNLVSLTTVGGVYRPSSGTSYASPMVAGLCLLVASANPCLTPYQIMDIVRSTADISIYNISFNQPYLNRLGTGRINAEEALKRAVISGINYQQNKPETGIGKYPTGNTMIWGNTLIVAGKNVTSSQSQGDVIIPANANVKYESFKGVELNEGFEVKTNSSFEIELKDSPCF